MDISILLFIIKRLARRIFFFFVIVNCWIERKRHLCEWRNWESGGVTWNFPIKVLRNVWERPWASLTKSSQLMETLDVTLVTTTRNIAIAIYYTGATMKIDASPQEGGALTACCEILANINDRTSCHAFNLLVFSLEAEQLFMTGKWQNSMTASRNWFVCCCLWLHLNSSNWMFHLIQTFMTMRWMTLL